MTTNYFREQEERLEVLDRAARLDRLPERVALYHQSSMMRLWATLDNESAFPIDMVAKCVLASICSRLSNSPDDSEFEAATIVLKILLRYDS